MVNEFHRVKFPVAGRGRVQSIVRWVGVGLCLAISLSFVAPLIAAGKLPANATAVPAVATAVGIDSSTGVPVASCSRCREMMKRP